MAYGAVITLGATLIAISIAFGVETIKSESMPDIIRFNALFYQYLIIGFILVALGLGAAAGRFLGWRSGILRPHIRLFIGVVVISAAGIIAGLISYALTFEEPLAIAGIVATFIVGYAIFYVQQNVSQQVNDAVLEEKKRSDRRKYYWLNVIALNLKSTKKHLGYLKDWLEIYEKEPMPKKTGPQEFIESMKKFSQIVEGNFAARIQTALGNTIDLFDDPKLPVILNNNLGQYIASYSFSEAELQSDELVRYRIGRIKDLQENIDSLIRNLENERPRLNDDDPLKDAIF